MRKSIPLRGIDVVQKLDVAVHDVKPQRRIVDIVCDESKFSVCVGNRDVDLCSASQVN